MADKKHFEILKQGVEAWNSWRKKNPGIRPNLSGADLRKADLRKADLRKADLIRADLRKADLRKAKLSEANLREANLREADLSGADLREADLSEANLRKANPREATLRKADLREADLREADLREANLREANLSGANLSKANLREANLREADLSGTCGLINTDLTEAILGETRFNEKDLIGVKYRPDQLNDIIILQKEEKAFITLQQKVNFYVYFENENLPLINLISIAGFIEYKYAVFYIFLFSQYDSVEHLRKILMGTPYHLLKDKDEALKVLKMSTNSLSLELGGLGGVIFLICATYKFFKLIPKEAIVDFFKCLRAAVIKSRKEKLEEEMLKADVMHKYADLIAKCRKIGVPPTDLLPPEERKEKSPPALLEHGSGLLPYQLERDKNYISTRSPRVDFFKAILFLRQEGLLTNKLNDVELSNLLEILVDNFCRNYPSNGFRIDM